MDTRRQAETTRNTGRGQERCPSFHRFDPSCTPVIVVLPAQADATSMARSRTAWSIGWREPAGERVLLARVVRADEGVWADPDLGAMREPGLRARRRVAEGGERLERGIPADGAERDDDPEVASSSISRTRYGRHVACSSIVGLFAGGAQRTAAAILASWSSSPSSARRLAGRSARPAACIARHRKSPDASPVNTRPVRLPPCAAGASPTRRMRAAGSPKPGHGPRPVGLVAEPRDLDPSLLLAPRDEARTGEAVGDRGVERREVASGAGGSDGIGVGHRPDATGAGRYLSSSRSSRFETTHRPSSPITVRYTTWTRICGPIAPRISERIRSTPWYSGVTCTTSCSSGG